MARTNCTRNEHAPNGSENQACRQNPKSEGRNPKQIRMSKSESDARICRSDRKLLWLAMHGRSKTGKIRWQGLTALLGAAWVGSLHAAPTIVITNLPAYGSNND